LCVRQGEYRTVSRVVSPGSARSWRRGWKSWANQVREKAGGGEGSWRLTTRRGSTKFSKYAQPREREGELGMEGRYNE